eukprot:scaffold2351_cov84-Skeletonema_dohrnii-CCMP3373.AAC.7
MKLEKREGQKPTEEGQKTLQDLKRHQNGRLRAIHNPHTSHTIPNDSEKQDSSRAIQSAGNRRTLDQ